MVGGTEHEKQNLGVLVPVGTAEGKFPAGELPYASVLDLAHPVSIGSYMNEPDVINNL